MDGICLHQHVIVTSEHFREIADHKNQWIISLLLPFKETSHSSLCKRPIIVVYECTFSKMRQEKPIEWPRLISVDFQFIILDKYLIEGLIHWETKIYW